MTPEEEAMEQLARDLAALNQNDSALPNQPTDEDKDEKK